MNSAERERQLLRETVEVVLRGALVSDGGTTGPGDRVICAAGTTVPVDGGMAMD